MNESRHSKLETLFLECVQLDAAAREALLAVRCAGDPDLRADVERLLARDAATASPSLAPVITPEPEPPPRLVGPYVLRERIGSGGFGDVYVAEQSTPIARTLALKLLRASIDTKDVLARFAIERQALALMDHPGIARVLDAGATEDGRPFVAMELVDGEPITTYCDRHTMRARERVELFVMVCRAVEHAHTKGVIHRDIKPSNILVTTTDGRPQPKVIDFGIAKATHGSLAEATLLTRAGDFVGTPEYASPEQLKSAGTDVDTRADVYSLGVVLFRLLAGCLPFESAQVRSFSAEALARWIHESVPRRPSSALERSDRTRESTVRPRELAGDLDWIVMRALHPDRERRYASAAALADDLERHLRDEPVFAGPPGVGYRFAKLIRRHRAAAIGVASVLLALVAGMVTTSWQAVRARRAEEQARQEAQRSVALNQFLLRMIAGANPEASAGGERTTIKAVLDRSVAELDVAGTSDAVVEGSMRRAMGLTYMGLGLYQEAELQLERAARLEARRGIPLDRAAIETSLARGELLVRQGRYAQADSLLRALEPAGVLAAEPELHARALQVRGSALGSLSRYDEADSLLSVAVALGRIESSPAARSLHTSLLELASVRSSLGDHDEAVRLAREAATRARALHAGDHHVVASALARLGELEQQAGSFAAAESLLREALAIDRRVFGPTHPIVATRLTNLAWVLVDEGNLAEAELGHREAVALHAATLGEDHSTVAIARGHLATVLQAQGKLVEAIALRRMVLAALQRSLGGEHEEVGNALNQLGSTLRLAQDYAEAVRAFEAATPIFRQLFGDTHPTLAIVTHNLGKTLGDAGRHTEAEPMLREAIEIAGRTFPPGHVNLAIFQASHGRTLAALGRHSEAEPALLAAHQRIAATLGQDHPRALEVAAELADLYRAWGKPEAARAWQR